MSRSSDASTFTAGGMPLGLRHDVSVQLRAPAEDRDRLSVAFRPILALPHMLLVGAPLSFSIWTFANDTNAGGGWIGGGGALGALAATVAFIAWFAILFTGTYPRGLYSLATLYLRWRVRAIAYMTLLADDYPPFGDAPYSAELLLAPAPAVRHRLSVAFRIVLALPHLIVLALLGVVWLITTIASWISIPVTKRMPEPLYAFGAGMLRWTTRVEAYLLLLYDEYPPFSLD